MMQELPFRTNETGLTDAQLILLDVMFEGGALLSCLRDETFREQWNLGYSHGLDDAELLCQLKWMCSQGLLERVRTHGKGAVHLTAVGGELWSSERCPVWERYCYESGKSGLMGRVFMSVRAVSPQIRDEFLALLPNFPVRRRTATVVDQGLISWHRFGQLFVGVALYNEQDEILFYDERYQENLERNRSWWQNVSELQRFVSRPVES